MREEVSCMMILLVQFLEQKSTMRTNPFSEFSRRELAETASLQPSGERAICPERSKIRWSSPLGFSHQPPSPCSVPTLPLK